MEETKQLGSEKVGRLLLKFSIPAVTGMLVNALYSVVDRIFVGRGVGSVALSGVAVTFPITNVIMALGLLIGVGSAAVISIKLGQKKNEEAEQILGNAVILSIIIPIIFSILGLIFLEPILNILGASTVTMPDAKKFASILLIGAVLQDIGFGLNPIIRSKGDPKTAMNTMLIGAALNFILNPIFIFGLKLGVTGSALATVISQTVCTVWIFRYFTKKNNTLRIKRKNLKLKKSLIKQIVSIGLSPFALQISASLVTIVINVSLEKYGGDPAIGAFSIINSIAILIFMPMLGVNQGAQPIIGYNYGADNMNRVKKAFTYGCIVNTIIGTTGCIIVQIFAGNIIRVFNTTDADLISIGTSGIRFFLLMYSVVGIQSACVNYFQAIGRAKYSIFFSVLRQIVILIPVMLILPHFLGLNGVWISAPISDFMSFVITVIIAVREIKKLTDESEPEAAKNIA